MRYGISSAAVIIQDDRLLLVHHHRRGEFDFWLPPGGRLEGTESIFDCAAREALEETNLEVELDRIVYVQEFVESDYHFAKFFILCRSFTGDISLQNRTAGEDFLVDARFFSESELSSEDVRPNISRGQFWADLVSGFPETRYLGLHRRRQHAKARTDSCVA